MSTAVESRTYKRLESAVFCKTDASLWVADTEHLAKAVTWDKGMFL